MSVHIEKKATLEENTFLRSCNFYDLNVFFWIHLLKSMKCEKIYSLLDVLLSQQFYYLAYLSTIALTFS